MTDEIEPLGPVADALERSFVALPQPLNPLDDAARALARRYACDIDEAPCVALAAQRVVEDLMRHRNGPVDPAVLDRLRQVLTRIEQTTVLAALGPKLNQVLGDLGLTTKARQPVARQTPVPGAQSPAEPPKGGPKEDDLARARRNRLSARSDRT